VSKQQCDKPDSKWPSPEHGVGPDTDQHGDKGFELANLQNYSQIFNFAEQVKQE
jgi:hypothetical protein